MQSVGLASAVVLALMALDILTGTINALSKQELCSAVMRGGIYKKFGSIVICALAAAISFGGSYIGMDPSVCGGVVGIIFGSIGIMEVISVIENACMLNPDLPLSRILMAFGVDKDD